MHSDGQGQTVATRPGAVSGQSFSESVTCLIEKNESAELWQLSDEPAVNRGINVSLE